MIVARLYRMIRTLPAEQRQKVIDELAQAASPGFDYFLLVVLSCAIATFGLITDSAAVIIGAMLVAPLMSPILGLSLASVSGRRHMFQRALVALVQGALLAVGLAAALGWLGRILPFDVLLELPHEVLVRTRPNPFDLGIALAGGAAAAYCLAQPRLSAALPGVAIATALMPPLCTVGLSLAMSRPEAAFGALLLFLTNFAAISFVGIAVFVLLGFRPVLRAEAVSGIPREVIVSAVLVLIVTVPLVALTLRFVNDSRQQRRVLDAVQLEVAALPDARLIDVVNQAQADVLNLGVTIQAARQPSYAQVVALQSAIANRLQQPIALQLVVVPATRLDPLLPPTPTPTATPGPSQTPTAAPTATPTRPPATATATATPTSTASATATETATPTQTYTPTPVRALVVNTNGQGLPLRETPAGRILAFLPEGASIIVQANRHTVGDVIWLEVSDSSGRTGWVTARHVAAAP